ncbi:MAG: dienelactone hydrolase family protein [Planctomycetota bacterium]|nr:dienelactone hydrolase family protein [Planctomycetota bacterium]
MTLMIWHNGSDGVRCVPRAASPGVMLVQTFLRVMLGIAVLASSELDFASGQVLPGTTPLEKHDDRSKAMRSGFRRFLLQRLDGAEQQRAAAEIADWKTWSDRQRMALRRIIGAVDERVRPVSMELVGTVERGAQVVADDLVRVLRVRWPVLPGVFGEGLLLEPRGAVKLNVLALPDAADSPEALCGLVADGNPRAYPWRLASGGCRVLVMTLIDRSDQWSGDPEVTLTNVPHREWIYRQAFELGRHIIGYEVLKAEAALEWLDGRPGAAPLALTGYGEGGLVALYTGALEPHVDATLVSGYFRSRTALWQEPLSRNLFGLLRELGDAEIAALYGARPLIVDHTQQPQVSGPPVARAGRRSVAAPGAIATPDLREVDAEVSRSRALLASAGVAARIELVASAPPVAEVSRQALERLFAQLQLAMPASRPVRVDAAIEVPAQRQRRQVNELVEYTQRLLRFSPRRRSEFWQGLTPQGDALQWEQRCAEKREFLWREIVGRFPRPDGPSHARSRLVTETARWRCYEVTLEVFAPDVFAWGYLLVPRDLDTGERRPVVVCQHGLEGLPATLINTDPQSRDFATYNAFAAQLADLGFVTFAPHNFYRGGNQFRQLQRMAHPLGTTLFGLTTAQHQCHLEWLKTLPFVDGQRIGFYGLSYGGNTAMRVPALLTDYRVVIASGDFNEWIYKNATTDHGYSMIYHNVWEVFEWNLGHTFNHSELAALIAPRPFMVERGHNDGVALDEWVAAEYARVRRLYAKLGIADKTTIEFFNGPHKIHGAGTYRFLQQHLDWHPRP